MNTVRKIYESDDEGAVRVQLPSIGPRRRVEVIIVWQEVDEPSASLDPQAKKRQELEALAGALAADPIERPEQGTFERREPIS